MMRLWMNSYARRSSRAPHAVISSAVHAAVIAAWVIGTLPSVTMAPDSIANRVHYIPPPDKVPGGPGVREVVRYVSLAVGQGQGEDVGQGPRMMGNARPAPPDESTGRMQRDSLLEPTPAKAPAPPPGLKDSVFTVLDVDSVAVRSSNSAAPAYPLKLLEAHVTGAVSAQYIVDTTGFADTASFTVVRSSNAGFVLAVKEALPYMRFSPAKIGAIKVRQLVEQTFTFKITGDTAAAAPVARTKRP